MRSRSATVAAARARISPASRIAIPARATENDEIEAGGRIASSRRAISGGARMYPIRAPASANAFEKVRTTTVFRRSRTSGERSRPPNSTYAWSITTRPSRSRRSSSVASAPVGLWGTHDHHSRTAGEGSCTSVAPARRVAFPYQE